MPRIIDSVLVYDDGPDKSTELDQRMPVTTVAGQPRRLDRKDGADPPLTDCSQQALETRPLDAASRAAKIIVDKLDRGPAELPGTVGEPVLAVAVDCAGADLPSTGGCKRRRCGPGGQP